ncbi:hypothetical protein [Rhizobium sp. YTU87027]|uniref:hypothetical protein n=2 Tax=Rhizobium/Agrobacterium group TaxID=227290 RepID=UPI003D697542
MKSGHIRMPMERIIVHKKIVDGEVEKLVAKTETLPAAIPSRTALPCRSKAVCATEAVVPFTRRQRRHSAV